MFCRLKATMKSVSALKKLTFESRSVSLHTGTICPVPRIMTSCDWTFARGVNAATQNRARNLAIIPQRRRPHRLIVLPPCFSAALRLAPHILRCPRVESRPGIKKNTAAPTQSLNNCTTTFMARSRKYTLPSGPTARSSGVGSGGLVPGRGGHSITGHLESLIGTFPVSGLSGVAPKQDAGRAPAVPRKKR